MNSGRNWQSGRDYGSHVPNMHHVFPLRATPVTSGGAQDPWRPLEERTITGPFRLTSVLVQPHHPVRILDLDNDRVREVSPRPREFVYESPPRGMGQRNKQVPTQENESRLTQEQKTALKKLKIEIYNPIPKKIRVNLYYREPLISYNEKEKKNDEDGKRCAICLDDFEPKEEITLTPCNHMFHEDCIVPWVKSHNQCPLCRFAL